MNKRTTMLLVKDIRSQLLTKCPNVFYLEGSEEKTYPRIIFEARPISETKMILELDLWNYRRGENIEDAEKTLFDLADSVEFLFDGMILSEPEYIASFCTNNDMKPVLDENKDFKHVNMSFDIIYQS